MSASTEQADLLGRTPTRLIIGAELVDAASGRTFETTNPATGEVLTTVACANAVDVDRAVAVARHALEGPWGSIRPSDRQRLISRLADLVERDRERLTLLDVLDGGGVITRVRRRVNDSIAMLHWYAAQTRSISGETIENSRPDEFLSYTRREPVGVVGAITPWNAPLSMAVWKLGPVLATGCTVVHKPAEQSPLSALWLGDLCLEAGIPEGVVNILTGDGEAGAALTSHGDVDKIAFTGSVETGQKIIEASAGTIKRLTLELGGKSPNIVFADADLDAAVPVLAMAVFGGSGQVCAAGSRLLVERSVYDEVVSRVVDYGSGLVVGDPLEDRTQLGPLISQEQLERVLGYIESGLGSGARLVLGGERLEDPALSSGFFVPPTVFTDVVKDMRIFREEIFGPVLAAMPFEGLDEAIQLANSSDYGLAAGVWTSDLRMAHRVASRLRCGTVWVNTYGQLDPAVPVGGYKRSGYGREMGRHQIDEYLNVKSVWVPS